MPHVMTNGIRIEYETQGDPAGRPLLMIMGLGAQLVAWDDRFCEALTKRGHWLIRFDNRDVGLSTKFDQHPPPDPSAVLAALSSGQPAEVPYTLDDMADDTVGLLDALGIERAHVCGASLGGMIAQTLAIRHPARLRSLISIMSTTGNPEIPPSTPEAQASLMRKPEPEREAHIQASLESWRVIGSPGFPFDEERIRRRVERSFDRCFHPAGSARQLAAVMAHGNRKPALAGVTAPTLVIHGIGDPLVRFEGGRDTAEAIPGSELLLIEGMGHDLPREVWPQIVGAISAHTEKHST